MELNSASIGVVDIYRFSSYKDGPMNIRENETISPGSVSVVISSIKNKASEGVFGVHPRSVHRKPFKHCNFKGFGPSLQTSCSYRERNRMVSPLQEIKRLKTKPREQSL